MTYKLCGAMVITNKFWEYHWRGVPRKMPKLKITVIVRLRDRTSPPFESPP